MASRPGTILCMTSYEKGQPFLREAHRLGWHVILVTKESLRDADWPREAIDQVFLMPELTVRPHMINAVSWLARSHDIRRLVALDEFDLEMAAALREHLRLPGMGETVTRLFRDKLAMRVRTAAKEIRVPAFSPIFYHEALRDFMARVPPPWMLKPRSSASAIGIRKIHSADELWPILDQLGDDQSHYLLEQFLPGEVYHVDSIVTDKKVVFAAASQYGAPPIVTSHEGGLFTSRLLAPGSDEERALRKINRRVIKALGMVEGVTHAEFIRSEADGKFYFLEIAARVGGAHLAEMIEAGTGHNLWVEWARIELATEEAPYHFSRSKDLSAGILLTLSRQEWPDLSGYQDEEVVWRLHKRHHAGLIVASPDPARVEALLGEYGQRFQEDFHATMPVPDRPLH
jgi:biotin carboxylase